MYFLTDNISSSWIVIVVTSLKQKKEVPLNKIHTQEGFLKTIWKQLQFKFVLTPVLILDSSYRTMRFQICCIVLQINWTVS